MNNNAPYIAASDTSRARAELEDRIGVTTERRRQILHIVDEANIRGVTWKEVSEITGLHHGQVSSVLTRLHETGDIFQLKVVRNGCHPYVFEIYKDEFYDYERNDQPVKTKANARLAALEDVARAAYALCYTQSTNAGDKWNALRIALAKAEIHNA